MTTEIADWMTAKTFHPQLTLTTGSPDIVVAVVRAELEREGYAVKEATSARIRLVQHDWLTIVSGVWARTEVVLSPGDDHVLVAVTRGPEHHTARLRGQRALNAAVASLRAQGTDLTIGAWGKAT
jgi:hypothetical protein